MVHRTVVVAPGHGVVRTPERPLEQRSWVGLYPYPEEAELLFEHCRTAVAMVVSDPGARLVFTGGPTQRAAGPVSEAAGYREMARAAGWWGCPEVEGRTLVEEYATDSLQNLVFAIIERVSASESALFSDLGGTVADPVPTKMKRLLAIEFIDYVLVPSGFARRHDDQTMELLRPLV